MSRGSFSLVSKSFHPRLFEYPQISVILPKYSIISIFQERASNGLPGHDLLFHGPKYMPEGNQLMFGGSDSGCLMAYSWQSGLLLSTSLEPGNPGVLRAFLRGGIGKRGLIRGWIRV